VIVQLAADSAQLSPDWKRGVRSWVLPARHPTISEDREEFARLRRNWNPQPETASAAPWSSRLVARRIGYPVLVRPSFVLADGDGVGGSEDRLEGFHEKAIEARCQPILVDNSWKMPSRSMWMPGRWPAVVIGAIMQHIEEAASIRVTQPAAAALQGQCLPSGHHAEYTDDSAGWVCAADNVQFALKTIVCVLSNRALRTVPYASKATA